MSRYLRRLVTLLIAAAAWTAGSAMADKRVALIIGNGAYRNVAALANPPNDATDVADAFARLGFAVTRLNDATFDAMRRGLIGFGRQASGAEVAVVFFAGHGIEVAGENWLIPVDAELKADTDVENEAVSLRTVMLQVANATQLGLVILDACRNNPFAAKMQRAVRLRAVERGLSRVEPSDNVLVAYAARDGTTAQDGSGRNSPFTAALLRHIETPGLEITFMFRSVRDDVMEVTRREQQPFVYGSLSKQAIYLNGAQPATLDVATAEEAGRVWVATKDSTSVAVLEDFIRRFGGTAYGSMARARLEELRKTRIAVATPTSPQAASSAVDPLVVGIWQTMVPNSRGIARWIWDIRPDGSYRFRSDGPGAAPAHEGTMSVAGGHWTLRTIRGLPGWEDGGTYQVRDDNSLILTGRLGTGIWRRAP